MLNQLPEARSAREREREREADEQFERRPLEPDSVTWIQARACTRTACSSAHNSQESRSFPIIEHVKLSARTRDNSV